MGRMAAILAGVVASVGGTRDASSQKASMGPAHDQAVERQCVGRFCVDVPAEMRRGAQTYEMRRVRIQEFELAPPIEGAFTRTLGERLAKVEALKSKRRTPTDPRGTVLEKRVFKPGVLEGAVYQPYNNRLMVVVGALLDARPVGVWLEGGGDKKFTDAIAADVKDVGLAYHLRRKDGPWPAPGKDWFYLGRGAVTLPVQEQEKAEAGFEGHPLGVKFEVTTKTTAEPETKGLAQRLSEALGAAGPAYAGAGSRVKHRSREAGGLGGEEMILRDSEAKRLYFMWDFPGDAGSGARPRVTLQMESRDERFDEKVALWDRLVDSLRTAGQ